MCPPFRTCPKREAVPSCEGLSSGGDGMDLHSADALEPLRIPTFPVELLYLHKTSVALMLEHGANC